MTLKFSHNSAELEVQAKQCVPFFRGGGRENNKRLAAIRDAQITLERVPKMEPVESSEPGFASFRSVGCAPSWHPVSVERVHIPVRDGVLQILEAQWESYQTGEALGG